MKKPNFFIIGAPKCGTTSLAMWLSEHPETYISPVKEPHFYCTDLNLSFYTKKEYLSLFKEAPDFCKAIGEASTTYFFSKDAIKNIEKDTNFRAKYILLLRNPVDMSYSLWHHLLWNGEENIKDFLTAWNLSEERGKGKHVNKYLCPEPQFLNYKYVCSIGTHLERLLNLVSVDRILILFLDNIIFNPRQEYLKVLKFLEVKDDGRNTFPVYNPAKKRRFKSVWRFLKIVSNLTWSTRKKIGIIHLGIGDIINRTLSYKSSKPPIPEEIRKELLDFFLPEIEKVEKILGISLEKWKN